jgi:hypothetical protein
MNIAFDIKEDMKGYRFDFYDHTNPEESIKDHFEDSVEMLEIIIEKLKRYHQKEVNIRYGFPS